MDPFCDIIGANRSLIAFHNISLTKLQAAKSTSVGINNLALLLMLWAAGNITNAPSTIAAGYAAISTHMACMGQ